MKKLLVLFLSICISATYAQWPVVSIEDLQFRDEASLTAGDDLSLYDGDTVTIEGIVTFDPCTYALSTSGSRIGTFLVTEGETGAWTGIHVLIDPGASGYGGTLEDLNEATLFIDNFQPGNVVQCSGIVGTFDKNTQIVLIDEPTTLVGFADIPEAFETTIDQFSLSDGGGGQVQQKVTGEGLEGTYVQFDNVFVVDVAPFGDFRWTWYLQDDAGNKIQIRDLSGFYRNDTNTDDECNIWSGGAAGESETPDEFTPPTTGAYLEFVRGIIVEAYGGTAYALAPLTPADLGPELATPPTISAITRTPFVPESDETVSISANIIDIDGTVASASLYYSVGFGSTDFTEVSMSAAGDTYTAAIPGPGVDGEYVNYYIEATDNAGNNVESPNSISPIVYRVVDGGITQIAQIQETPFTNGASLWAGGGIFSMDIEAVVMASRQTYDLGWLIVQDSDEAWSGIRLFSQPGDGTTELNRGDVIRITSAAVREDFGATLLDSVTIEVLSTGGTLYNAVTGLDPEEINAQVFDAAEAYESMLLRFDNVFTTSNNPDAPGGTFGEWRFNTVNVAETGLRADDLSFEVPFEFAADSVTVGEPMDFIQGILTYSFSNFKLEPRDLNDIAGFTTVYPNTITAFNFDALGVNGIVNQDDLTIQLTVPTGTDVTALIPSITFTGVSVSPAAGVAQDFTNPVTYTCFAPVSGDGKPYNVTVVISNSIESSLDPESLSVFPNPAGDNMAVNFTANMSDDVQLSLADLTGRKLMTINMLSHVGKNISELDLRGFPNGLYLLQIESSSGTLIRKIEVSR